MNTQRLVVSVFAFLLLALLVITTPSFSQQVNPRNITLNGSVEWHLIGIPASFVTWNLPLLANSGSCGGWSDGWIKKGWMFKDNRWLLTQGSDTSLPPELVDVGVFTSDHVLLGLWVQLDTTKIPKGANCVLFCGSAGCGQ